MTPAVGERLLALLSTLCGADGWTVERTGSGAASEWQLAGATWDGRVIVDPSRWIGLKFAARDPETGRVAHHAIDTDLYDIGHASQHAFARAIEDDIIEFLGNLRDGRVLCGKDGPHFVVTSPQGDAHLRVSVGRFTGVTTRRKKLVPTDGYTPVR